MHSLKNNWFSEKVKDIISVKATNGLKVKLEFDWKFKGKKENVILFGTIIGKDINGLKVEIDTEANKWGAVVAGLGWNIREWCCPLSKDYTFYSTDDNYTSFGKEITTISGLLVKIK